MSRPTTLFLDADADTVRAALEAAGFVGIWTHDVWADRLVVSAPLAQAMGLDPAQGARGLPLSEFIAAMHVEDRARVENALHAAVERGGAFEIAFRTHPASRWIVLRGRIGRDATGRRAQGQGIAIDLTDERTSAEAEDRHSQHVINRLAEHAIAMRGLVGGLRQPVLSKLLDSLMLEIGFELARHLSEADHGRPH